MKYKNKTSNIYFVSPHT